MNAIVYYNYGAPDELHLTEVKIPVPHDNEVLIKVQAASINSWDWDLLRGEPFIVRLVGGGFLTPKKKILGCDVAGLVEAIGDKVTQFQPGDEVFGDLSQYGWGGFAEYVCAPEHVLTIKPDGITFEQAAALPQAAVMALQGIRDYGKVQPTQKVLINGAGGGVGTFAIQMAKFYGAEVTGVDSTEKLEIMKSLGADHVIDYKEVNFTKNSQQYDLILDVVGYHSIFDFKQTLTPTGMYRMIGGQTSLIFQSVFIAPLISLFGNKKMGILAHDPNKGLEFILDLIDLGKIVPVIDRCFTLQETADAFRYFGKGLVQGKVVIKV